MNKKKKDEQKMIEKKQRIQEKLQKSDEKFQTQKSNFYQSQKSNLNQSQSILKQTATPWSTRRKVVHYLDIQDELEILEDDDPIVTPQINNTQVTIFP